MKHFVEIFDIDLGKILALIVANISLSVANIHELIQILVGLATFCYIVRKTILLKKDDK